MRGARKWLVGLCLVCSCGPASSALPAPEPGFHVVGAARAGDGNAPHIEVAGSAVIIGGTAQRLEGGELHGEFDLSEPGTVRLTLYDSLPGRPIEAAPAASVRSRPVRYEARIGPLPAGSYDVIVGHYDPRQDLIIVRDPPVRVRVSGGDESARPQ